jgi:hypothetical protein
VLLDGVPVVSGGCPVGAARDDCVHEGLPRLRAALEAHDDAYKLELVTAAGLLVCYMPLDNYRCKDAAAAIEGLSLFCKGWQTQTRHLRRPEREIAALEHSCVKLHAAH